MDVAAHVAKLKRNLEARIFCDAGGEVMVMGWRELKSAGGWMPRIWHMSTSEELGLEETLKGDAWQPRLVAP
jgi:hypothetical protein